MTGEGHFPRGPGCVGMTAAGVAALAWLLWGEGCQTLTQVPERALRAAQVLGKIRERGRDGKVGLSDFLVLKWRFLY